MVALQVDLHPDASRDALAVVVLPGNVDIDGMVAGIHRPAQLELLMQCRGADGFAHMIPRSAVRSPAIVPVPLTDKRLLLPVVGPAQRELEPLGAHTRQQPDIVLLEAGELRLDRIAHLARGLLDQEMTLTGDREVLGFATRHVQPPGPCRPRAVDTEAAGMLLRVGEVLVGEVSAERRGAVTGRADSRRLDQHDSAERPGAVEQASRAAQYLYAGGVGDIDLGCMVVRPLLRLVPHPVTDKHDALVGHAPDDRFGHVRSLVGDMHAGHIAERIRKRLRVGPAQRIFRCDRDRSGELVQARR